MSAVRRGILLDIEGTTTPIRFVSDVLFPYARARLSAQLEKESDAAIESLRAEHDADLRAGSAPPAWEPLAYAQWLMDRDRKSTALKALQGRIWQEGYRTGELRGEVYPDVPPALARFTERGSDVRIFSSGSVLAQKLLFSTTPEGDLTRFLSGFFDTTTGAKTVPGSYARIAAAYGVACASILFVSDVSAELDAARQAGMETLLCVRPGNPPQPAHTHPSVDSLASI